MEWIDQASSSHQVDKGLWKAIWHANVLPKIKHHVWRACLNALAINENLFIRNYKSSPNCPFCSCTETIQHLLLEFTWTKGVWFGAISVRCSAYPCNRRDGWLWHLIEDVVKQKNDWKKIFQHVMVILWHIWKHRNEVIFQKH